MALLDKIRGADNGEILEVEFSDDFQEEMVQDPAPGKPEKAGQSRSVKPAPKRATAAVRKQLADELQAYLLLGAGAWQMRDQYCGEVLEKQSQEIALRLAEILGRNAQIVSWLHTTDLVGSWLKLWLAVKPLLDAVRDHHIKKTVEDDGPDPYDIDYPPYRPAHT